MRATIFTLVLSTGLCICSCSDAFEQSANGLSIQTTSQRYRAVDTVQFIVLNSGDREGKLACWFARLSFFLQRLDDNMWRDHDSINIGPCLALYGPIAIAPGQTISGSLAVASLQSISVGDYRIRIQYMVSGEPTWKELYSNSFQITN